MRLPNLHLLAGRLRGNEVHGSAEQRRIPRRPASGPPRIRAADRPGVTITDTRVIGFEAGAVLAAVAASPEAAAALGLPAAPPDSVRFVPAEHRVDLFYRVGEALADFSVPAESLGALLVGYCCRHRIAIPRGTRKSIRIEERAALLCFMLQVTPGRGPGGAARRGQGAPP